MEKNIKEIRCYDFSKENREFAPHLAEENSRIVEGYAIVFNQPSRKLFDKASKKVFTETIDPRAVTKLFLDDQDIKMLYNHSNDMLMARSTYGFGTLSYEIDDYGVKYRFEMPNTSLGNDVLELIRRGDVWGCSFAFTYAKDGIRDEKKNGQNFRTVIQMASISDFSIVVDPAYLGTYVSTREFSAPDEETENSMAARLDVEWAMLEMDFENL
jgi:HK97 family phage prohead protease